LITSIATELNEARISAIKRQIIGAFSTNAMLDYEPHIDLKIESLMSRIGHNEVNHDKLNIAPWMIFYAFDTICRIAFSDDQGLLEKQADLTRSLEGGRQRFNYWHTWQSLPWLEKLLYKNRWALERSKKNPTGSILGQLAGARVKDRLEKGGVGTHADLLDRFLQGMERQPDVINATTVHGLVMSMIHAGAETTSATLNVTLYYLMKNPRVMAKLRKELAEANLSSPPQWNEVNHLRYLEACIKEAGRLKPLLLDPIEREVPANGPGIEIAGVYVPPGMVVAVNTHALNLNPAVWGPQTDEYRPERWIECDEAQLQKMERSNLFFSGGRRICIGMHIAWIEMKKVLPELLTKFDVSWSHVQLNLSNLFAIALHNLCASC
jgi:cytochrome P450